MAKSGLTAVVLVCLLTVLCISSVKLSPVNQNADSRSSQDKSLMWDDIRFAEGMDIQNGVIDQRYRWPNRVVFYKVDPRFSPEELEVIMQGMKDITSKTVITFKERINEQDYVYVQRGELGSGCYSYIGRIGGIQLLNLQAPDGASGHCVFAETVAHEFIHAIGFLHEHVRPDRDRYVTIKIDNVTPGQEYNFEKQSDSLVSVFDVPYDYRSIMHYEAYAFAIDPKKPTIVPTRPGNVTLGGPVVTSFDAIKINRMYGSGVLVGPWWMQVQLPVLTALMYRCFMY